MPSSAEDPSPQFTQCTARTHPDISFQVNERMWSSCIGVILTCLAAFSKVVANIASVTKDETPTR